MDPPASWRTIPIVGCVEFSPTLFSNKLLICFNEGDVSYLEGLGLALSIDLSLPALIAINKLSSSKFWGITSWYGLLFTFPLPKFIDFECFPVNLSIWSIGTKCLFKLKNFLELGPSWTALGFLPSFYSWIFLSTFLNLTSRPKSVAFVGTKPVGLAGAFLDGFSVP